MTNYAYPMLISSVRCSECHAELMGADVCYNFGKTMVCCECHTKYLMEMHTAFYANEVVSMMNEHLISPAMTNGKVIDGSDEVDPD